MKPIQIAVEALKHMIAQNDKRIKEIIEIGQSLNNNSSDGLAYAIAESWRKDSEYLNKVLKVLQSEPKKIPQKKKNKSKKKQK
ncbi:MAG: hypothetical protein ACREAD_00610 [Nitrosopumilaceae archaeon]